jgi:DNA-binding NtrC family response regulator
MELNSAAFHAMIANTTLEMLENAAIASTLLRLKGNKTAAAGALGISLRTMHRKVGPRSGRQDEVALEDSKVE